jgi:DNA-binding XRE family transcriptional regulator
MTIRHKTDRLPTGAMIRAARGLVGLETTQLAEAVGVTRKTIFAIERDQGQADDPRRTKTLANIRDYLVDGHGVVFLFDEGRLGEGVRLSRPSRQQAP